MAARPARSAVAPAPPAEGSQVSLPCRGSPRPANPESAWRRRSRPRPWLTMHRPRRPAPPYPARIGPACDQPPAPTRWCPSSLAPHVGVWKPSLAYQPLGSPLPRIHERLPQTSWLSSTTWAAARRLSAAPRRWALRRGFSTRWGAPAWWWRSPSAARWKAVAARLVHRPRPFRPRLEPPVPSTNSALPRCRSSRPAVRPAAADLQPSLAGVWSLMPPAGTSHRVHLFPPASPVPLAPGRALLQPGKTRSRAPRSAPRTWPSAARAAPPPRASPRSVPPTPGSRRPLPASETPGPPAGRAPWVMPQASASPRPFLESPASIAKLARGHRAASAAGLAPGLLSFSSLAYPPAGSARSRHAVGPSAASAAIGNSGRTPCLPGSAHRIRDKLWFPPLLASVRPVRADEHAQPGRERTQRNADQNPARTAQSQHSLDPRPQQVVQRSDLTER